MAQRVDISFRLAAVICAVEGLALLANGIAVGIASFNSFGFSESSAPLVEVAIFVAMAILMGALAKALFAGSRGARPPLFITQILVIVVGFTLWSGEGTPIKLAAVAVGLLGLVGIVLGVATVAREPDRGGIPT